MQKIHSKDYTELEKSINRKLRKLGSSYIRTSGRPGAVC